MGSEGELGRGVGAGAGVDAVMSACLLFRRGRRRNTSVADRLVAVFSCIAIVRVFALGSGCRRGRRRGWLFALVRHAFSPCGELEVPQCSYKQKNCLDRKTLVAV